jgi:hypothetical protein
MYIRTYNNLANEAAAWNSMMNRFFNNLAYEYGRSGGSTGNGVSEVSENGNTEQETVLPLDVWTTPDAFSRSPLRAKNC